MKKRGFTLVEFTIAFCLISAVAILLFQLILSIKTLYLNGNMKTTLLSRQGIMLQRINDDYDNNFLRSVSPCGVTCLTFSYATPDSSIKTANLEIDPFRKTITYDGYTIQLEYGNEFGNINVTRSTINSITNTSLDNSLLTIDIPIHNSLLNENFDIKINLPYRSSATSINLNLSIANASIKLDDMDISIEQASGIDGYFANIFYHNVASNPSLFTSIEEVKRSENANKKSALFALDLFKGKYNTNLNKDVFEFVLQYPSYSATEKNHWYQSNNFFKSDIEDYMPISIAWNNKWNTYGHFTGIKKISENGSCGFLNTNDTSHDNCYTVIGAKKLVNNRFMFNQDGRDLNATSVRLYARCDEFIEKYALVNVIK